VNTEQALEEFYDALLDDDPERLYDRAPCGYLSTTPDGMIVKVNQTFLTWTGYERDALVRRKTFAQLLTAGGRIYHETHYAPMLRMSDSVREIALEIVRADGTRLPVLVNSVLDRSESGEPGVIRTAVFDATERREYERELMRAKQHAEESETRARTLARTLQETLIPPTPPHIPGLDVAAVYRPAGTGDEVGGDFYDVFQTGSVDWVVVIGDVCGKGVDAAVVTAVARYTLRAAAIRQPGAANALVILNDVLLRHETDRFCTVSVVRLHQGDGGWTATIASGGHPLPVLVRAGLAPSYVGEPGSLVGVLDEADFFEAETLLSAGDELVVYTDGVTEGRRADEQYGEDRLFTSVARGTGSASSLAETLLGDVLEFQQGYARDDIAVVALRVPG
jgi:sigma-B regulation protein RsbU (phosphoserine phosphatase)